ncbi:MAG: HD domain-containing protein [Anaerolineales bacterium]|nr:HD domain-containing protein [Anaerolineales bacterium]
MRDIEFAEYEKITRQVSAKELSTLLKVSSCLASTLDLAKVLQISIESVIGSLSLDTGAIYTLEDKILHLGATSPPLPPEMPRGVLSSYLGDHPHIENVVHTKSPVYLYDARIESLSPAEKIVVDSRHLISILYFPLLLKEDVIGVFIVGTTSDTRLFTNDEVDLCYILSYEVSLAIANAQLYKKAQQAVTDLTHTYDATLEGWSRVLDMRDHATDEHTQRVTRLTIALAEKMGIPESEIGHIRRGALLHDIGKMAIPDTILQKPSRLSKAEIAIMRTHPEKAYELLSNIDYLIPALDIPYCHHEKWDGTGYPRKLKGEEIPLSARLFAVVDVYDALTSNRPYRKAWKKEKVLAYIRAQSGKHFFPDAVEAFIELLSDQSAP